MKNDLENTIFDAAIIGGGLAGLSLSILLAKAGYKVILFEKEKYPFHKVCGEYISMESRGFITRLGLNLEKFDLPVIKKLRVSSPSGNILTTELDLGGFGISRFLLDHELKKIAEESGVLVKEMCKVNDVQFLQEKMMVKFQGGEINAKIVAGTFGKKSNLDVKWNRGFIKKKQGKLNNYIGVKYHIRYDQPADNIALHNFKNGYAGISKVEGDTYCLCYLTSAQNLKEHHNSIKEMEQQVLYQNPHLKKIFTSAEFLWKDPETISQVSFDKKNQLHDHVLLLGDAAGMITPLCGNGMSMALHSAAISFEYIDPFLKGIISRGQMEQEYADHWNTIFSSRLRIGRVIQRLFGKPFLTNIFISTIRHFPFMIKKLIRATHGKEC